ncbi:MAG: polysaccharide deacetylase family protein [Anaerofustis stercorihominis]|nr:polysaccharide deacetylase family protein [Anaerofustis stercorihominis]
MIIKRRTIENIIIVLLVCVIICSFSRFSLTTGADVSESYDVPIIMYHAIMKDSSRSGKYVITPDTLRRDIEYILKKGYTPVHMSEIIDYVDGCGTLPEKPIVLTFDDGYYNNYLYAYPITKEYGVKAVISIIGTYTRQASETGEKQVEYYSHVTWSQLKEMTDSALWEVQNHTYDMHRTGDKNGLLEVKGDTVEQKNRLIEEDIMKLQELITQHTGKTPDTFTYPFGSFDSDTRELIKKLGFRATLSCHEGINNIYPGASLDLLCRYNRDSGLSSEDFFDDILN